MGSLPTHEHLNVNKPHSDTVTSCPAKGQAIQRPRTAGMKVLDAGKHNSSLLLPHRTGDGVSTKKQHRRFKTWDTQGDVQVGQSVRYVH